MGYKTRDLCTVRSDVLAVHLANGGKLDRYKVEQRFTPGHTGGESLDPRNGMTAEVPEVSEVAEVSMDAAGGSDGWHREAMLEPSQPPREYTRKEVKEGVRRRVEGVVRRMAQDRGYVMRMEDRPRIKE